MNKMLSFTTPDILYLTLSLRTIRLFVLAVVHTVFQYSILSFSQAMFSLTYYRKLLKRYERCAYASASPWQSSSSSLMKWCRLHFHLTTNLKIDEIFTG